MNITMICSDLDRTLLKSDDIVTDFTLRTIRAAIDAGVLFVPVTGRSMHAIPGILKNEPGIRYYISTNGALIYDREEKRVLRHLTLSFAQVEEMFARVSEYPAWRELCIAGVNYADQRYFDEIDLYVEDAASKRYLQETRVSVPDLSAFARAHGDAIESAAWFAKSPAMTQELAQAFGTMEGVMTVVSTPYTFETGHAGATKGQAMLWLAGYLGIDRENVMGCGDALNDVDLVRESGFGVAVANAHPAVLEAADCIADSHKEDGIAKVMCEVLGLQTAL